MEDLNNSIFFMKGASANRLPGARGHQWPISKTLILGKKEHWAQYPDRNSPCSAVRCVEVLLLEYSVCTALCPETQWFSDIAYLWKRRHCLFKSCMVQTRGKTFCGWFQWWWQNSEWTHSHGVVDFKLVNGVVNDLSIKLLKTINAYTKLEKLTYCASLEHCFSEKQEPRIDTRIDTKG